ncbi:hypothetical protein IGI37_003259 [Enterococcus sp. AZ194]|uniref:response regulator transcription factor n=1 Tax=Enterococcus sp. AZ194 TaxID=2774629 RepID=UPI003F278508
MQIAIYEENLFDLNLLEDILNRNTVEYTAYSDINRLKRDVEENNKTFELYIISLESEGYQMIDRIKQIRDISPSSLIVFLTDSNKYMPLVFEIRTFDYLQKPITKQKISLMLQRAAHYLEIDKKYFHFTYKRVGYVLDISKIIYFEKKGRTAYIYHADGLLKTNMTMQAILNELDEKAFIRIHSAYIINLNYIRCYTYTYILMENPFSEIRSNLTASSDLQLPVSRAYKDVTMKNIGNFLNKK